MPVPKTYAAMLRHIAELQTQAETLRVRESQGVLKRIREAMAVYGLTAEDLIEKPEPKKPKPVTKKSIAQHPLKGKGKPAKYADNAGHTWAGGGSLPVWLREQVEAGKSIEDFLIKKVA